MRQLTTALTAAVCTAALVLVVSGCESSPADTAAASPAGRSPQAGGPPTGPAGRSLWTLIDDKGATVATLPDDDPDVAAVRKAVALHSGTTDNRDHRSVTGSPDGTGGTGGTEDEFTFYSPEFVQALEGQGYGARLASLFRDNKLATRQVKTAWYRSTIYQDRKTAKADMDSVIEFTAATPGYLKKGGFALNTPYTQHRTVSLAKQDGRWKITGIQKSPMVKESTRPTTS
ncbi:hypothetical protein OG909_12550 [Streptomyces sp. NBC_01754]|uniref:hypothetical protein n=1 Tax=Streptomyces sp. NBC_01754 TaxID=2975930 RepID=UPI002DD7B5CC|nr:hypothetical protein [Streptomyces sp. NBC_01754]WSC93056.1 hypothetical protein OG909_12550 [Streptomyces sp. NBC_01754]